jgi:TonB-dependent SusC/RagA subfamily outer membrane receptor
MVSTIRLVLPVVIVLTACGHGRTATTQRQSSTPTGTVLTAEDIQRSPGQSLEQLLLAHVPGLTVTAAPDGHAVLHLRGTATFLGYEEPLIVVNGIALGPNASGNLNAIDPQDIAFVQVLRDAASTAAYGVRGANGVILIRTKQS